MRDWLSCQPAASPVYRENSLYDHASIRPRCKFSRCKFPCQQTLRGTFHEVNQSIRRTVPAWRLVGCKVGKDIIAGLVKPNPDQDFRMLRQKEFNILAGLAAVATLAGRRDVRWLITTASATWMDVVGLVGGVAAVDAYSHRTMTL